MLKLYILFKKIRSNRKENSHQQRRGNFNFENILRITDCIYKQKCMCALFAKRDMFFFYFFNHQRELVISGIQFFARWKKYTYASYIYAMHMYEIFERTV